MDLKSINSPIISAEDGMVVRLLPNIDDNGLKVTPIFSALSMYYRSNEPDMNFMVNDDLDFPLLNKAYFVWRNLEDKDTVGEINITERYYCYVLDHKFDIKILRFSKKIYDVIYKELEWNKSALNPAFGRALEINSKPGIHGFADFGESKFIEVMPLNIGQDDEEVRSYLMNNREISIEKYLKQTSWYGNDRHRVNVVNTMLKMDSEGFAYLKKFLRQDKINDLLRESE